MHRFLVSTLLLTSPLLAEKLLVLDSRVIESVENAQLRPGTVIKHDGNPLFQADKPWENSLNNLYPNVIWDDQEKIFKMWYKCVLADKEAIAQMDGPSTVHDVGWYLLYATSKDGLKWEKPKLGLHAFGGTKATNIVARDCPNVGVFKDLHDVDPTRRYKMVSDVGLGKPQVRFSPDGIHWSDVIDAKGFGAQNGDTHNNAFWDEGISKYVWFTKLYLGERLVARLESDDFVQWKNNGLVLRSGVNEGRGSQTYCMPVFRYAGIYLGYLMMYHVGNGRTVDCELVWSPDGLKWQRVAPGIPLIPRGQKGSYDSECIYAMAGPPIVRDGRHLIFYGGDDFPHTGWKRHCLPCLATLREDGFAGFEPVSQSKPAKLTTRLLRVTKEPFRVIADDDKVQVTATDEAGLPVEQTSWAGKVVRFHLVIPSGKIYGLEGVELINKNLPVELNPLKSADWKPQPVKSYTFSFDTSEQFWKGVDAATAHDGILTVSRSGRNLPIAYSSVKPSESPIVGDWTKVVGGRGARISCRIRSRVAGGRAMVEIFANDVGAWQYETDDSFNTDWQEISATLRYDWSDEEAQSAGWKRAANGFSWRETIQNIGKLVVVPSAAGAQSSFDLDDVRVQGLE
ncbi:MAG: hypothetical protein JNJ83_16610 [Verrucomicrobiaceae bacterium]|nr:hypothetical protein [Verrucomicrobiaceae bacterium]